MDEEKYKEAWQYSHQRSLMLEEVLQDTLRELQELGLADRLEERWRAGEQGLEKHNIEPLQSLQWRDIESAPKAGFFIGKNNLGGVFECQQINEDGCLIYLNLDDEEVCPTQWLRDPETLFPTPKDE